MLVMSEIHLKTQQTSSAQLMVYEEDCNSRQVVPILLARKKDMPADNRTKKPQSKHITPMNHIPNRNTSESNTRAPRAQMPSWLEGRFPNDLQGL